MSRGKWLKHFFFFFGSAAQLWGVTSLTRIELGHSAVRVRSPNHWTAREFPDLSILILTLLICKMGIERNEPTSLLA